MQKYPELVIFGMQLRQLRVVKGFSQESLAHASGINPCYYGSIERGEKNIATRNLIKIADALKVEVGDLFPPHFLAQKILLKNLE
jgi:transcriptional regulator with XRE-family HTH domain